MITHCRLLGAKWRSFASDGKATFTTETSSTTMKNDAASNVRMNHLFLNLAKISFPRSD